LLGRVICLIRVAMSKAGDFFFVSQLFQARRLQCSPYPLEEYAMSTVVRARVDARIKEEASAVLARMGLSVSDVFRILLTRVAREKALPFEPLAPNAATIEAMTEARRGNLETVTLDELQAVLDADD
jgi:DNA-damage-inducible protein J